MRKIFATFLCLVIASAIGAMGATSFTCSVGLFRGTDTWCGLGYFWIVAIPMSAIFAIVLGGPMYLVFRWLRVKAWWQYTSAGAIAAVPGWFVLAQPFASARWEQFGLYDTLNYLGTGALAALAFHFLLNHVLGLENAA